MKRLTAFFAAVWLLIVPMLPVLGAEESAFSVSPDRASVRPGEQVTLSVAYDGSLGRLGAFLMSLSFDPQSLELLRVRDGDALSGDVTSNLSREDEVRFGFVAGTAQRALGACDPVVEVTFRVLPTVKPGELSFSTYISDLVDPNAQALSGSAAITTKITVERGPSSEARLFSLLSEQGELEPPFESEVFAYRMEVPYETQQVSFLAEPAPGAKCSVNRKNLGSAGSDTDFLLTVTAEDGKAKQVYTVTVHRGEKPPEAPKSDNADLLMLWSEQGELEPAFSSDVLAYRMVVPFEVQEVFFGAEAPEGATVKVNRKNLGAGGSDTDFLVTVTAEDGKTKQVYTVTVHRSEKVTVPGSDDAALLMLSSDQGDLTPAFSSDVFQYRMTVPYEVKQVFFDTDAPQGAKVQVNRKNLGAGGSDTDFLITVTAEDGKTKQIYTVTVHRSEKVTDPGSDDATLLMLTSEQGELTPAFSPTVFQYRMTVPYEIQQVFFSADVPEGAIAKVNRKNLGSGGSDTDFLITVTAADGQTKQVYTVTVHRSKKETDPEEPGDAELLMLTSEQGDLTPAFSPSVFRYRMTVPYEIQQVFFNADVPEGATARVNRKNLGSGGSDTDFLITVTAADGKTKQVYTVTVHRSEKETDPASADATLLMLTSEQGELTPAFSPTVFQYRMTVPYEVQQVSFNAEAVEGAAAKVNRKNLGSGGSDTDFLITVTAADGKTKQVYTVTVHRSEKETTPASADATLLMLTSEQGDLSPAFSPDIFQYRMTVPFETQQVFFEADPAAGAAWKVNRKNLGSGGSDTDFLVTVTAEDGKTKQVYTVTVHRSEKTGAAPSAASSDATLWGLTSEQGELEPEFSPDVFTYQMRVPNGVQQVFFEADPAVGAAWKVNRKNLGSGGSDTDFLITVTAEDGKTKQVYTVTVHREAAGAPVPVETEDNLSADQDTVIPVEVEPEEEPKGAVPVATQSIGQIEVGGLPALLPWCLAAVGLAGAGWMVWRTKRKS